MKIGLDFDGVISDCRKPKYKIMQRLRRMKRLITRDMGSGMEPVKGALVYIPRLIQDGHSIVVITSRDALQVEVAQDWAKSWGIRLPFIGTDSKSKAEAAAGLDVFIDDDFFKLEELVGVVPRRYLFSWEYNEHEDVGDIATRVSSWEEFYLAIQRLKNG